MTSQNNEIPNEVLLQVKNLDGLRKSFRENPLNLDENGSAKRDKAGSKNEPMTEMYKTSKTESKGGQKKQYVVNFLSELLGTTLLMFLGCMGCITQVDNPPAVHHMSSLAFGLVILLIIQIFGHISGAHLNPAVTISTVIFKMLTPLMGLVYIVAQFLGALLGFALLRVLMPQDYVVSGFCATKPHALITPMQGLAIETIITCVLILVCCGVWDKRNAEKQDSTPARFGFIVAAISMVAGPLTGASMNTARSFPPAFFDRDYSAHWIYWVGPNVGAILGCGLYSYLFAEEEEPEEYDGTQLEEMITEKA